jgi:hypothetical protein
LDYEKQVSTGAQAKVLIGSFWPFSTASTLNGLWAPPIAALRKAYSITSSARARIDCGSRLPRKALRRRLTAIRHGKFLNYKSMLTL